MSTTVIRVESLSKYYRLGLIGGGTLREDLNRWWAKVRGRSDGCDKVGMEDHGNRVNGQIWALQGVNLEVSEGEILGVVGRNGAGKSTLLKILSRITAPTKGEIKIKGRIGSLLEVGTGFHPELTGRENIYLNGTILGMNKGEISKKFDDIVAFSGVENYIDTPVKRYSSGMQVRLAFSVAAHLEPEILLVDEVLAIGDVKFQRKCLGKMQSIRGEGRTVLFVSHNMSAVSTLCSRAVLFEKGRMTYEGDVEKTVQRYLYADDGQRTGYADIEDKQSRLGELSFARLLSIGTLDKSEAWQSSFRLGEPMKVRLQFSLSESIGNLEIGFAIFSLTGIKLQTFVGHWEGLRSDFSAGRHTVTCTVESVNLFPGGYALTPWLKRQGEGVDDQVPMAIDFEVIGDAIVEGAQDLERYPEGGVFQRSDWSTEE